MGVLRASLPGTAYKGSIGMYGGKMGVYLVLYTYIYRERERLDDWSLRALDLGSGCFKIVSLSPETNTLNPKP